MPRVHSISTSGHKFGLVYPGLGWVVWAKREYLPEELIFNVSYLGGNMPTLALNFSRPGAQVLLAVLQLPPARSRGLPTRHAGVEGRRRAPRGRAREDGAVRGAHRRLRHAARHVDPDGRIHRPWDLHDLSAKLRERGWQVPAYPMPADIDDMTVMRVVFRNGVSIDLTRLLLDDMRGALTFLDALSGPMPKDETGRPRSTIDPGAADMSSGEYRTAPSAQTEPEHARAVLLALILVAAVANLNLAVANVALPSIGAAFDSSQTALDLIAVGYSLGLAASVLYLGALGDRHGRKLMLIVGTAFAIPASLLAAYAPTDTILFIARLLGGLAAGMAYPTTLALITALWSGPARTKSIALWSALGGAISALGPLLSGLLLEHFWWGSVFLLTLPLAVVALVLAIRLVPAHVNETTDPVDNLGGILSVLLIAAVVLAINFAPVPNEGSLVLGLVAIAIAAGIAFIVRQRRARNPLYDLHVAGRRIFWVAACAGIIVFGTLMAAMFVGQQFLQNVLGYDTLDAGMAILPAAFCMVLIAPRSAKLVEARGARFTLLIGYVFCLLGFVTMLLLWNEGIPYWEVGLAYGLVGVGVGFAGTPASHSLTGSVPVERAGMASGTADLQRDLGGAIMQSILGALLTAGYAAAATAAIGASPNAQKVTDSVSSELTKSFASAEAVGQQYPQYASQITAAAKTSFLQGADWAYTAGIVAIVLGAAVVYRFFPKRDHEQRLLAEYHVTDTTGAIGVTGVATTP